MHTQMALTIILALCLPVLQLWATVYPMGGVRSAPYVPGTTLDIRWDRELNASNVDIGIWDGLRSKLVVIATDIPASAEHYAWTIPDALMYGDRYRIMVRDSEQPLRAQFTAGYLTMGAAQLPVAASVMEVDAGEGVQCSPFPANDNVTISWSNRKIRQIELLDIHHRQVLSVAVDPNANHQTFDIQAIASGMFFARLEHTNGALVVVPMLIGR